MSKLKKKKAGKGVKQRTKKKKPTFLNLKSRKKHVETMFLSDKVKKYPYYFKDRKVTTRLIFNRGDESDSQRPKRNVYCLRSLEAGFMSIDPMKATVRVIKWYLKNYKMTQVSYRVRFFPDFVLTSKPREIRMGKGKGAPKSKVALVKKGDLLLEFWGAEHRLKVFSLIVACAHKLPFRTEILKND